MSRIKDALVAGLVLAARGARPARRRRRRPRSGSSRRASREPRAELRRRRAARARGALRGRRSSSSTRSTGSPTRRSSSASRSGSRSPARARRCSSSRKRLVVDRGARRGLPARRAPEDAGDGRRRSSRRAAAASRASGLLGSRAAAPAAALGAALRRARASRSGPCSTSAALYETPWRRGRRLVDEDGRPLRADEIEQETFYTAFPEGADREQIGAPLVVVRLDPAALELPAGREGWAPEGIVAYSKICTHAGCAIALYRKPTFAPTQPRPALVCPCHYSTFDPAQRRRR